MATALDMAYSDLEARKKHMTTLRTHLVNEVKDKFPEIDILNPEGTNAHYKILIMTLPLNDKTTLAILNLDIQGIAVSGGSACSSGAEKGSHVFDALYPGLDKKTIRVSFSHLNTIDEVNRFVDKLSSIF
jgi:cysteine desulfurase